jgi:hypothetical protein
LAVFFDGSLFNSYHLADFVVVTLPVSSRLDAVGTHSFAFSRINPGGLQLGFFKQVSLVLSTRIPFDQEINTGGF